MVRFRYPVGLEVAADHGMFANPASGSEAVSYPFPPPSAGIGMFTSVCRVVGVDLTVVAVAVCSLPKWTGYTYNSRNMMRKPDTLQKGQACQIREMVLEHPRFQILALAERNQEPLHEKWQNNTNPAHAFQVQFYRRLRHGQNFRCPSMGRKEFLCTYVGPIQSPVEQNYTTTFPSMLFKLFTAAGEVQSVFKQNVLVKNGVLEWETGLVTITPAGCLAFIEQAEVINA